MKETESGNNTGSKILAILAFGTAALTIISALVYFVFGLVSAFRSFAGPGAPDTEALANGINVIIISAGLNFLSQILMLIMHFVMLRHSEYLRPWIWRALFYASLLSLLFSIFPPNFLIILLSVGVLIIVGSKKEVYFAERGF